MDIFGDEEASRIETNTRSTLLQVRLAERMAGVERRFISVWMCFVPVTVILAVGLIQLWRIQRRTPESLSAQRFVLTDENGIPRAELAMRMTDKEGKRGPKDSKGPYFMGPHLTLMDQRGRPRARLFASEAQSAGIEFLSGTGEVRAVFRLTERQSEGMFIDERGSEGVEFVLGEGDAELVLFKKKKEGRVQAELTEEGPVVLLSDETGEVLWGAPKP